MKPIKPTIHLNGTSADELLKNYRAAYNAILNAQAALQQTAPHGRDYYVQSGDSIAVAISQHVSRVQRLETVRREIEELAIHVSDHVTTRDERR